MSYVATATACVFCALLIGLFNQIVKIALPRYQAPEKPNSQVRQINLFRNMFAAQMGATGFCFGWLISRQGLFKTVHVLAAYIIWCICYIILNQQFGKHVG